MAFVVIFCPEICDHFCFYLPGALIDALKHGTKVKVLLDETTWLLFEVNKYLIQTSQAVKKECGPEKGYGEKRCEIQGGGQEMAVMVG